MFKTASCSAFCQLSVSLRRQMIISWISPTVIFTIVLLISVFTANNLRFSYNYLMFWDKWHSLSRQLLSLVCISDRYVQIFGILRFLRKITTAEMRILSSKNSKLSSEFFSRFQCLCWRICQPPSYRVKTWVELLTTLYELFK